MTFVIPSFVIRCSTESCKNLVEQVLYLSLVRSPTFCARSYNAECDTSHVGSAKSQAYSVQLKNMDRRSGRPKKPLVFSVEMQVLITIIGKNVKVGRM